MHWLWFHTRRENESEGFDSTTCLHYILPSSDDLRKQQDGSHSKYV